MSFISFILPATLESSLSCAQLGDRLRVGKCGEMTDNLRQDMLESSSRCSLSYYTTDNFKAAQNICGAELEPRQRSAPNEMLSKELTYANIVMPNMNANKEDNLIEEEL